MGKNSRARRAAKQRKRQTPQHAQDQPQAATSPWHHTDLGRVSERLRIEQLLLRAVSAVRVGDEASADGHLAQIDSASDSRLSAQVVSAYLEGVIKRLWRDGWQPVDVMELARRHFTPDRRELLLDAIAQEAAAYSPATVHHRWQEQLEQIGARVWWSSDASHLDEWCERHRRSRRDAMRAVVDLVVGLSSAPTLERILPLPGTATARSDRVERGVDEKMLARIRALLAKAEATDFPDEAEALSSKAQELMTKFSLDHALVEAAAPPRGRPAGATARRIWLDPPYVMAKSLLANAVASANSCKAVVDRLGFVTVVGDEIDLQLVEVLCTSLLLQADRAMLSTHSQRSASGQSRTRSFRQSFLASYARRIRERLAEAKAAGEARFAAEDSARLLPVLAAREVKADTLVSELFPRLKPLSVSASNAAGWAAGRTAADLADLDGRQALGV